MTTEITKTTTFTFLDRDARGAKKWEMELGALLASESIFRGQKLDSYFSKPLFSEDVFCVRAHRKKRRKTDRYIFSLNIRATKNYSFFF